MKLFDKTWKLAVSGAVVGLLVMLAGDLRQPGQYGDLRCLLHPRYSGRAQAAHCSAGAVFPSGDRRLCLRLVPARTADEGIQVHRRFFADGALYSGCDAMMIGALVFLGCPLRMVLRMAAGDLNAWVALIGFAGGVATGSFFLKKGFSLGRAYEAQADRAAHVLPVLLAALLVIGTATGVYACQHRGSGQQARADYPFSGRGAHYRRTRAEEPYVLCRQHPRRHPDEKL